MQPGGARFTRHARLCRPRDYARVFAKPRRSSDRLFTILFRRGPGPGARLGLAVSKKTVKRAVDRNALKRLVRESFRHNRFRLDRLDVVVMVRPAVTRESNDAISRSLGRHWDRLADSADRPGG